MQVDSSRGNLDALLPEVIRIAHEAGEKIMAVYKTDFRITTKPDDSPVTTADIAADTHIINALKKLSPLYPVLSEEGTILPFDERAKRETYWLIDPLDGTKEFIKKRDNFTVNIALIHQHKPILGVVYAPALGDCYYACKNSGSFKQDDTGKTAQIKTRKLPTTPTFAGSYAHGGDQLRQFLDNVKACFGNYELLTLGSSLKMCLVAEGKIDLYPRLWLTSEWDTAAAHCIINEAGGKLVKTDMSPLRYNTKDSLLNPFFFAIGDNDMDWVQFLPKSKKLP